MKPQVFFYVLLGILGLSFVGGGAGLYFTNQILQKNGDIFTEKELELSNTSNRIAYLQKLEYDTEKLEADLGSLTSIYPKEKQQAQVIDQLLKLAAARDISLGEDRISFPLTEGLPGPNSQLTESPVVPGLYGMNVSLDITGTFEDTISFMQDIENFRRIMNISSVEMTPSNGKVTTSLQLEVLVQQAPPAPATPATGGEPAPESGNSSNASAPQGAAQ
jgi:Tfp pilus assembly protein PilO